MQSFLRTHGPAEMSPTDMAKFQSAYEKGELLAPEQCVRLTLTKCDVSDMKFD